MYTYKQFGNKFVLSIQNRAEITEAIIDFVKEQNINTGAVYGIGAVNEAVLRFYDPITKEYVDKTFSEQMEISNLTGNISTMDSKPYIHLHITLGRSDYTAVTGHLLTAKIHGAGELMIEKLDGEVGRKYDDDTGLNLYDL